jgi:hypothetical protein
MYRIAMNSTSLRDAPFVTMVPTGRPWMRKSTTHRCTFLNCDRWMVPRRIENVHLCANECIIVCKRLWFLDFIYSPASWNEYWTLYVPQVKQDRAMAEGPRKRKCREDVGKATVVVEEKQRRREALGLIQYMWRGFFRAYLIRVV